MIGSLFAGTEEAPGETILYQGRTFSLTAAWVRPAPWKPGPPIVIPRKAPNAASPCPKASKDASPYKGPLSGLTDQLVGGLKSGMGYVGARTSRAHGKEPLHPHHRRGLARSHVHDVVITKEAPNYRME